MKLGEILRFELLYQLGRPWPWLSMAVLAVFAVVVTRVGIVPVTLPQDFILNSPFIITAVTVIGCQVWLLVSPAIAGEAAARDVHERMYPLVYATPVSETGYLAGRFLAALAVNALILLAVQVGSLLAVYGVGANPELVGPLRPGSYLAAYAYVALPNALIGTTVQFSAALASGRPMAAYVGSLGLFFLSYPVTVFLYVSRMARPEIALLSDPIGVFAIMNEMMSNWTLVEKNVRAFRLEGPMLWNRLLWVAVAMAVLALARGRFRFTHRTGLDAWARLRRRIGRRTRPAADGTVGGTASPAPTPRPTAPIRVPAAPRSFGTATRVRQLLSIAGSSFRVLARSPAGLFLLVVFPALLVLVLMVETQHWGIPLLPRTEFVITRYLTSAVTEPANFWVIVPLLVIYFASELVWRERDEGLDENVDATPVGDWVLLLGKYLGLALMLAALMAAVSVAGITAQLLKGYRGIDPGQYVITLLGLQLAEFLLFGALALGLVAVVNHKHVGLLAALVVYMLLVFSDFLGIRHHLLVWGTSPDWSLTDIRGFGASLGPWLWFKLYWAGWAALLAVAVRLLWVRGRETGFGARLRRARRPPRPTVAVAAGAAGLVAVVGGFVFYNTNVLNEYLPDDELVRRRAEYERRYGRYEGKPQPALAGTTLRVEIYPERGTATVRGRYHLVNRDAAPVDSVHLEPAFYVDTRVTFDRPFARVVHDPELGHDIYALAAPLQPGDTLALDFEVDLGGRGFANGGARSGIVENGSHFASGALPVIGYQPTRELWSAEDRRAEGLPRQVTLPAPGDIDPGVVARPPAPFEAIVGTAADQVGVAPGRLRRTWTQDGRRYFHYASEEPISGTEMFFSADYAVHREDRNGVDLQVYLHPDHAKHLDRLLRAARAALDYYSAQFGPYPYPYLQLVEQPGNFLGMGVDGSGMITGGEGFFLLDPEGDGFDAIFEIVAHEVGHQWWGMQLKPALAAGGGVISESLAWYSAMRLVNHVKGREALRRFMRLMRQPYPHAPLRTGLPLLQAMDPWANYRKGPYAMHALAEYAGEDRVNAALGRLVEAKASSLATTLDMYRELQAATPDSLRPLLHDLFEADAFWSFDTRRATAKPVGGGAWEVTFEVEARKVVADSTGNETEVPIAERVEIGVFAPARPGEVLGEPLYVRRHRVRSGGQTITVTVPGRPARGGIDPYNLLDWEEGDNIEGIVIEAPASASRPDPG